MDLYQKISVLGPGAKYDTCGPKDFGETTDIPGVYHATVGGLPAGRQGGNVCRLFKVLQTNSCINNCKYCAFRRDRDTRRVVATSDEMAAAFNSAHSRRLVDGLFLSSGVIQSPETTMTRMLDTAQILRQKYQYRGYLHLKIMPGASAGCIRESIKLANRISLNIESPTEEILSTLAPEKDLKKSFFYTLSLIKSELTKFRWSGKRAPSLTTQFVVGAGEETDKDVIQKTHFLYKNFGLKRVFYSAFRPVPGTPLEGKSAASLTREHRLYQADFLMRFYRFSPQEIPLDEQGFLSEVADPKMLWAQRHPELFPINLNTASYWQLLKIPGLGPVSAKKIVKIRSENRIQDLSNLAGNRLQLQKLSGFVCL